MLVDRGQLAERDGSAGRDGIARGARDSRHASCAHRISPRRGVPVERSLLQDAAVLGQSFSISALAAVSGRDPAPLRRRCGTWCARSWLALDTDLRSPNEAVRLSSRSDPGGRVWHAGEAGAPGQARRCSRALRGLDDEELVGVVATHYAEAQRAPPRAGAGLAGARAREWLTRAGRRALALGSRSRRLPIWSRRWHLPGPAERAALLDTAARRFRTTHSSALWLTSRLRSRHTGAQATRTPSGAAQRLAEVLGDGLEASPDAIARAQEVLTELGETGSEEPEPIWLPRLPHCGAAPGRLSRPRWAETRARWRAPRRHRSAWARHRCEVRSAVRVGRHREAVMLARGRMASPRPRLPRRAGVG